MRSLIPFSDKANTQSNGMCGFSAIFGDIYIYMCIYVYMYIYEHVLYVYTHIGLMEGRSIGPHSESPAASNLPMLRYM